MSLTEAQWARLERVVSAIVMVTVAVIFTRTGHDELANVSLGAAIGQLMPARVPAATGVALGIVAALTLPALYGCAGTPEHRATCQAARAACYAADAACSHGGEDSP